MARRLMIVNLLLLLSLSLTGCLVAEKSNQLGREREQEINVEIQDLTEDFFSWNEYDSTQADPNYNSEELVALFKEKLTGSSLTIDPIIGPKYDKSYNKLTNELEEQESIFEAQANYNYKLLFKDENGDPSYKVLLNNANYTYDTVTYDVLFQVFEEAEGKRLLTDNGVITFELVNRNDTWLINHLTIDYRELGSINLGAN